jgi:hypothetical protein
MRTSYDTLRRCPRYPAFFSKPLLGFIGAHFDDHLRSHWEYSLEICITKLAAICPVAHALPRPAKRGKHLPPILSSAKQTPAPKTSAQRLLPDSPGNNY